VQVIPFTTLSSAVASDEPPKEFKIFSAGKVETTKGTFTFDDVAAKSVMAEYAKHGTDLMIDYDHASLADAAIDPALAGKAAGWFDLELRNGELWAVNVRWTPAAEAALRAKEWRYTSPAGS
jgi:phage I-like protein